MRFLLFLFLLIGCAKIDTVTIADYQQLKDSIAVLNAKIKVIPALEDSIDYLKSKPIMTKAQFIELYKFDRLNKYYRICKNNPTQWKYYKGWSIRVFENQ